MSALMGMTITALLFLAAFGIMCVRYLKLLEERGNDDWEFRRLELAWEQLQSAVRQLCADVEQHQPKRGPDGRFVKKP